MAVRRYWRGDIPDVCEVCQLPLGDTMIDGRHREGGWQLMCPACHQKHGVGFGIGYAQKYVKQPDGQWLKTEG